MTLPPRIAVRRTALLFAAAALAAFLGACAGTRPSGPVRILEGDKSSFQAGPANFLLVAGSGKDGRETDPWFSSAYGVAISFEGAPPEVIIPPAWGAFYHVVSQDTVWVRTVERKKGTAKYSWSRFDVQNRKFDSERYDDTNVIFLSDGKVLVPKTYVREKERYVYELFDQAGRRQSYPYDFLMNHPLGAPKKGFGSAPDHPLRFNDSMAAPAVLRLEKGGRIGFDCGGGAVIEPVYSAYSLAGVKHTPLPIAWVAADAGRWAILDLKTCKETTPRIYAGPASAFDAVSPNGDPAGWTKRTDTGESVLVDAKSHEFSAKEFAAMERDDIGFLRDAARIDPRNKTVRIKLVRAALTEAKREVDEVYGQISLGLRYLQDANRDPYAKNRRWNIDLWRRTWADPKYRPFESAKAFFAEARENISAILALEPGNAASSYLRALVDLEALAIPNGGASPGGIRRDLDRAAELDKAYGAEKNAALEMIPVNQGLAESFLKDLEKALRSPIAAAPKQAEESAMDAFAKRMSGVRQKWADDLQWEKKIRDLRRYDTSAEERERIRKSP